jgi:hypothetical protein
MLYMKKAGTLLLWLRDTSTLIQQP